MGSHSITCHPAEVTFPPLSAYGPADATAIPIPHHLLPHLNPDWFYLSGTGLPGCPGKEVVK